MLNTNEILEQNGLNWNVVKVPLLYAGECEPGANNGLHDTPFYGIVREDTGEVFATVKKSYEPTQNSVIIETMQEIAEDNELDIVKAIPLHGGRKVVVQMKRPDNITVIGGETTEEYIYAINGHDGTTSLKFGFMNKVIFCQNQFAWLSGNALSGYRHTKSIQEKVQQLPGIINFTDQYEKIADLQHFAEQSANPSLINDLVDYLANTDKLPISTRKANMVTDLSRCIDNEMSRISHTKWGVFNGVTQYTTHMKSSPNREYGQQESILTGSCGKMNEKAFKFLKAY